MKPIAEFQALSNDVDRWKWVINNQDTGVIVNLDNDETFITFKDENEEDYETFCHYIGWSDGVTELLEAIGVRCEFV